MRAEKVISNISSVLGIIAFLGTIVTGFLGEKIAAYILIGLTLLFWLIWLTVRVISLSNQVARFDNPIEKSSLPLGLIKAPMVEKYLDSTSFITSARKNELRINSNFLRLEKCTVLINVLVPETGQALRNAPKNKYILGHKKGEIGGKDANVFALRYSMQNQWELVISNDSAVSLEPPLQIRDGLEPGWHQFMIAWNRFKSELVFFIDCGSRGSDSHSGYLSYWPEKLDKNVSVGAWSSPYDESYVETRLANLWICHECCHPEHSIVSEHRHALHKVIGES